MKKKDDTAAVKGKKSKGFYLELEEATGITPTPNAAAPATPAVTTPEVVAPATVVIAPETTKVETAPEPVAPAKTPKAKAAAPEKAPEPAPVVVANVVPDPEILPAYLQMNNTPRRRPGANMTMFKNMAQQMGTPKN